MGGLSDLFRGGTSIWGSKGHLEEAGSQGLWMILWLGLGAGLVRLGLVDSLVRFVEFCLAFACHSIAWEPFNIPAFAIKNGPLGGGLFNIFWNFLTAKLRGR